MEIIVIYLCSDEKNILPCKKDELQCGNGLCLLNWLRCHYRKNCAREYTSIKLICSKLLTNQSGGSAGYPQYNESSSDASLLVSPLVVAGIVIGLVLFLSCMTIIVGSFRKDSRLRNSNARMEAHYAPDALSFGGSIGELRSTCIEDYAAGFDFDSYTESLSQVNAMYQDSPPHYEDCVRDGVPDMYLPEDDPPPYSLTDPWQGRDPTPQTRPEQEVAPPGGGDFSWGHHTPLGHRQEVPSVSSGSLAPPYERVVLGSREVALPLTSQVELKDPPEDGRPLSRAIV
ncbi:protein BEAN1 isoform X2 [Leucoraja erinacea]|uniref:protein BEAN1 isoform X2 n=1 Tax=Leucoraja erinaceus TaxID=7782 RepID=UPI002455E070|nr:protein BEAN1 isoform X2 [Leucoraja erinacea]